MKDMKLGVVESQFANLIWSNEPISTTELVKLAEERFEWKRTTTHTVINRLCEKGLFQKENRIVTSKISREAYYAQQSRQFVDETFHGSLPAFIAAFTGGNSLTQEEAKEIREIIKQAEEGD